MRNIEFRKQNPPIDGREFRLLESRFDGELPPQYRNWLRLHDGGFPGSKNSTIKENTAQNVPGGLYISEFFSAKRIFEMLQIYGSRIQHGFIPIAKDGEGNLVCLALLNEGRGGIYFWSHELEPDAPEIMGRPANSNTSNLFLVAASFDEFLQLLGPDEW